MEIQSPERIAESGERGGQSLREIVARSSWPWKGRPCEFWPGVLPDIHHTLTVFGYLCLQAQWGVPHFSANLSAKPRIKKGFLNKDPLVNPELTGQSMKVHHSSTQSEHNTGSEIILLKDVAPG